MPSQACQKACTSVSRESVNWSHFSWTAKLGDAFRIVSEKRESGSCAKSAHTWNAEQPAAKFASAARTPCSAQVLRGGAPVLSRASVSTRRAAPPAHRLMCSSPRARRKKNVGSSILQLSECLWVCSSFSGAGQTGWRAKHCRPSAAPLHRANGLRRK